MSHMSHIANNIPDTNSLGELNEVSAQAQDKGKGYVQPSQT